jgi:Fe-S-cluster-containing dehydrogenase component
MSLRRREFLAKGVLATGALAAGAAGTRKLLAGGAESPPQESMTALTVDGRLVQVPVGSEPIDAARLAAPVSTSLREGIPGRKWVMVIDLANCDGCDDCIVRCRDNHAIPIDREWIRVYKMQDSPDTAPYWFPKPCFHCDNAPCTKVCPVGATFKRSDGLVLIDNDRCIGCRFCMAACPYSTRVFNWGPPPEPAAGVVPAQHQASARRTGTVEKCDFCVDDLAAGHLPHCATSCTMGAIYFGDANEDAVTNGRGETLRFSKLMQERAGYRFLEELGTEPRVYYLPPSGRVYPPPRPARPHHAAAAHTQEAV